MCCLQRRYALYASRNATHFVAPSPQRLLDRFPFQCSTSRWMERACNGFWCPGYGWDVAIGPTGGAVHLSMYLHSGTQVFPDKVYLCSKPCPASPDECEVLSLDPTGATRPQSKHEFPPGTIVHIGVPLAPLKEHFSLRMRLIPPCNGVCHAPIRGMVRGNPIDCNLCASRLVP